LTLCTPGTLLEDISIKNKSKYDQKSYTHHSTILNIPTHTTHELDPVGSYLK